VIRFKQGEIGTVYKSEIVEAKVTEDSILEDDEDEVMEEDEDIVPVSKEGIPLNKEGVCSPAEIKIRSLKEGGRPNPRRLQLITISSPKASSKEDDIDENDLSLILEDTTIQQLEAPVVEQKKRVALISVEKSPKEQSNATTTTTTTTPKDKKRVPFVTLNSASK
jgi:hypothetical protein